MKILIQTLAILVMLSLTTSDTNPTSSTSETYNLLNATNLAKQGCESRCGDLIVPYPFGIVGINSSCSIGHGFDIYCNTSTHPQRAFISKYDYTSIKMISDSTIRTSNVVNERCYYANGGSSDSPPTYSNLSNWPYTFSQVNKFTVIGCDDSAWLTSLIKSRGLVSSGCLVFCPNTNSKNLAINRDCAGEGCCQSSIPRDMIYYSAGFGGSPGYIYDSNDSSEHCTYSFLGDEKASSKFIGRTSILNISNTNFLEEIEANVPVVFDWAIGEMSCEDAKETEGYACQSNSYCVSSPRDSGGYRCLCNEGYEGNPYLSPGCQDINECNNPEIYTCYGDCVNTPGNYTCNCKRGFSGDAKFDNGCQHRLRSQTRFFALGVILGTGILVLAIWIYKVVQKMKDRKLKMKFFKRNGGLLLQQQTLNGEDAVERTRLFSAKELEKATDHYNGNRIVGRGGQGTVYKGMLTDGKIVAVKKSKLVDECQVEPFINEVFLLSQISHRNVVKLLGCCLETEVPVLVYEFVSNGDLFQFIHDENYDFPSLWSMRLQIATEVAGALAYMHSATSIPIYHRDIKSSNILLDEKFRAKLSDFGISKSVLGDQSHLSTLVKGTYGYIDPEYFQSNQFTDKSDVYSFGIVLGELLTGKKPIFSVGPGESRSLATLILSTEEGLLLENIDGRVLDGPTEQLIAVAKLAKRCLNLNGRLRPTMKEVATNLEEIRSSH